ncbi:MAG: ATP-binding protein [Campylobacterota bacterium]|nr:ATP-binding protein [Campylobacterota bacterium]
MNSVQIYLSERISNKTLLMECKNIISEIIYNIFKYAPSGTVKITQKEKKLFIEAEDNGSGITNLNEAIKDGYSSSGTLGLGLGTIFRLADDIDIQTSSKGTIIKIEKELL